VHRIDHCQENFNEDQRTIVGDELIDEFIKRNCETWWAKPESKPNKNLVLVLVIIGLE